MKLFLTSLLIILFFGSLTCLRAQDADWRVFLEQLAEEEEMHATAIENMYGELLHLENNPMNLNRVTRDQLERFPLLSMEEIVSIITFLEKNRPLYTVYELRNVPSLEITTIRRILPFFYVGEREEEKEVNIAGMMKRGTQELQFRLDKCTTPRAGYATYPDSILEKYPNRKYRGEDFYTSLRYSFRYRDRIEMGFTAEKDAGEPFLQQEYAKGYDHYGLYLLIRDQGVLKTLALGDYRLSFGQGLILNNDFMVSKAWSSDNIARRTQQPKRHFSTAESGFFRGVAAQFGLGKITLTPFYSNRRIDANLSGEGEITSFKDDGLHRTPLEIGKRRNTREQVAGANINYRREGLQIGVSALYHTYNRSYNPTMRGYNLYSLRGFTHSNASVDYSWQRPGLILAGETAIAENGAVATLNMAQYRPSAGLSFTLLHRHFPISYNALYAEAFAEGGSIRNEKGLFLGALFTPLARFTVNSYIDIVRFPWPKYGVETPSRAVDLYLLGRWQLSRRTSFDLRYKYKQKEKNMPYPDENSTTVLPYATHKLRLRYSHELQNGWSFRSTADGAHYKVQHSPAEKGYMLSQNISYRGRKKITGDIYLALFNAESYYARLYSYERNLLSSFYMPSFYGKGVRLALSAKYAITPTVTLSLKTGHTHYYNRDTIGSGTEMISGNSRSDLYLYLRWKF